MHLHGYTNPLRLLTLYNHYAPLWLQEPTEIRHDWLHEFADGFRWLLLHGSTLLCIVGPHGAWDAYFALFVNVVFVCCAARGQYEASRDLQSHFDQFICLLPSSSQAVKQRP